MAVIVVITPVLQKAENCEAYQEITGCYKGMFSLQSFCLSLNSLYARKKDERQISLTLIYMYISVGSIVLGTRQSIF